MRAVRKLTGAFVMAGFVAAALAVSVTPAAAEAGGPHSGEWKACTWIKQTRDNMDPANPGRLVLDLLFSSYCM
jgi:hypothetical protein